MYFILVDLATLKHDSEIFDFAWNITGNVHLFFGCIFEFSWNLFGRNTARRPLCQRQYVSKETTLSQADWFSRKLLFGC
ncbi:hypothetical protein CHS0354_000154 [Potamilus streckersoni]|uniref:Uncharacterized protein n=1 Tax=Potamilus streckersoni TaxID=2493646 RepID=A0AAE0TJ87_9BIVA|nr:hypothetical protein CHS0354_000154 [Potamilus streckersoni]